MSASVLAIATVADGAVDRPSLEAITVARGVATETGGALEVVLVADAATARGAAASLATSGAATAIVVEHPELTVDHPDGWAATIAAVMEQRSASAVVAPGTERGNELLARVAARTGLPMAANCLTVTAGDRYRISRQRWAGSLIEECWLDGSTKLLSVAPNTVAATAATGPAPTLETFTPTLTERDLAVHVTSREPAEQGKINLADARVVVGGGRGVGSTEGFAELEELAALLGGAVGGSRVVTSAGWRPHADQIGQTGMRIAPDLYIACGISGAIQHIVGSKASKHILAINTDPEAPIMSVADYAVIGDLHAVVPAISAEIRRRSAAG